MKKFSLKKQKVEAFTLIEMLIVLIIISILILLFVPNLAKQKEKVNDTGRSAVVKVVEGQAEMYELNNDSGASLSKLLENKSITQDQYKAYKEYYDKHTSASQQVPN